MKLIPLFYDYREFEFLYFNVTEEWLDIKKVDFYLRKTNRVS